MSQQADREDVIEGTDPINVGRVVNQQMQAIVRADFQTWDLTVVRVETGDIVHTSLGNANTDTAVFFFYDTLQKTTIWGLDSKGFNFEHKVLNSTFSAAPLKGGSDYRFEYRFQSTTLGMLPADFLWRVKPSSSV